MKEGEYTIWTSAIVNQINNAPRHIFKTNCLCFIIEIILAIVIEEKDK